MTTFTTREVLAATGGALVGGGTNERSFGSVTTDSRAVTPGALFVALRGEKFDGADFVAGAATVGAAGAVVERSRAHELAVPPGFAVFAVPDALAALGRLAAFHRERFRIPIGGVGGSNGKTSTKEMVAAILARRGPVLKTEGNLNNEIGVPQTLLRLAPEHRHAVVEMGMNHPGELTRLAAMVRPSAALITSLAEEHLEGLGTLEAVAEAEGELYRGLVRGAPAGVNLDEPLLVAQAKAAGVRAITFGRADGADVRLAGVTPTSSGVVAHVARGAQTFDVPLAFLGGHMAANACGAWALGLALGFTDSEIAAGLPDARGIGRRMRLGVRLGGGALVDDCYNANPGSMAAALATVEGLVRRAPGARAVAVLGDMLELGPGELALHRALGAEAARRGVQLLVAFGPRSRETAAGARAAGLDADAILETDDPADAAAWVAARARPADVVLVKGSRGMRLERICDRLTGEVAAGAH